MMNGNSTVNLSQKVQGIISAKVFNAAGEVVREVPEFCNLITDAGLDFLCSGPQGLSPLSAFVKVGTGGGAPANGDVTLPGFVASQARTAQIGVFQTASAPYYYEGTYTYLYALGAINATLTCIGAGSSSGSGVLAWSQIKDMSNTPTTITVLSTEQLQVTYKFRLYAPAFTSDISMLIGGAATYDADLYAHSFGAAWGTVGGNSSAFPANLSIVNYTTFTPPADILSLPAYTGKASVNSNTFTWATYTAGSFNRNVTATFNTTSFNAGGSKALEIAGGSDQPRYVINLNGTLAKDNTNTLSLTFNFAIARYV